MLLINCKSAKENPYNCSLDVRYENGTCIWVCRPTIYASKNFNGQTNKMGENLKNLSEINPRFCVST